MHVEAGGRVLFVRMGSSGFLSRCAMNHKELVRYGVPLDETAFVDVECS